MKKYLLLFAVLFTLNSEAMHFDKILNIEDRIIFDITNATSLNNILNPEEFIQLSRYYKQDINSEQQRELLKLDYEKPKTVDYIVRNPEEVLKLAKIGMYANYSHKELDKIASINKDRKIIIDLTTEESDSVSNDKTIIVTNEFKRPDNKKRLNAKNENRVTLPNKKYKK